MNEKTETAILIHGLWMHGVVLLPYQRWLRAEGFAVRRFSYPSRRVGLDDNVRLLSRFVSETQGAVIHLVAHSLGGLVVLKMLSEAADQRIRRAILLGTPFAGCHVGSTLARKPVLAQLIGRTFEDWFRLPRPVLPAAVEIGVVAGTRRISLGRIVSGLARPNDGLIAVEETHLATARDSIALNVGHSGMLASRNCAGQVASFLRTGNFIHV
ncbi:MAG: alpha/beta fold hydrolase [Rhodocyclaceae bacterium]|nr:MAG: alpha/beta fold hydrolase [Rhodocyclaceae bacterium]